MATPPNTARTTPDAIRRAIQRTPDGPIILWHFASTRDPQHLKNKSQLNTTCTGPGNGLLRIGGALWKLVIRTSKTGGGFALLEKVTPEQAQRCLSHVPKNDIKQWWLEQLVEKGYLNPDRAQPTAPERTSPAYLFHEEED